MQRNLLANGLDKEKMYDFYCAMLYGFITSACVCSVPSHPPNPSWMSEVQFPQEILHRVTAFPLTPYTFSMRLLVHSSPALALSRERVAAGHRFAPQRCGNPKFLNTSLSSMCQRVDPHR